MDYYDDFYELNGEWYEKVYPEIQAQMDALLKHEIDCLRQEDVRNGQPVRDDAYYKDLNSFNFLKSIWAEAEECGLIGPYTFGQGDFTSFIRYCGGQNFVNNFLMENYDFDNNSGAGQSDDR